MDHVNCIRIKPASHFSQMQEEVMKSEKEIRSCQKNENNRPHTDGNGGAFSSSDIYNMEML
jgi:hypothetical protein